YAELGHGDDVSLANDAMTRLVQINQQLSATTVNDATSANLLDQRDRCLDQLAQLMDINVVEGDHHQVTVSTNSGISLVGVAASTLAFDPQGSLPAASQWNADPTKRSVGTLVLTGPDGGSI